MAVSYISLVYGLGAQHQKLNVQRITCFRNAVQEYAHAEVQSKLQIKYKETDATSLMF